MSRFFFSLMCALAVAIPSIARGGVVLVSGDVNRQSALSIHLSDPLATSTGITTLPYNNFLALTGALTTANITGNLTTDSFALTFAQSRPAGAISYAQSQFLTYVTVSQYTTYSLGGAFGVVDAPAKSSTLSYSVYVYDNTAGGAPANYLYLETQYSGKTSNAVFDIGGTLTGDQIHDRTVNSVILEPGKIYAIGGSFFLGESGFSQPPGAANASGNYTISFTTIPEPTGTVSAPAILIAMILRRRSAKSNRCV